MRIIIIRHADPDYPNNTLTETGFIEAEALGEYLKDLKIDKAYTSPMNRSVLTSDAVLKYHGMKAEVKDWLQEFNYYINVPYKKEKNLTWDLMPSYYTKKKILYSDKYLDSQIMKSGNIKDIYLNVITQFDDVLKEFGYIRDGNLYRVEKESNQTVVFFCHFGIMCVLMSRLVNLPYEILGNTFICPPSGITTFISEEREKGKAIFRCNGFGDVSHLSRKGMSPSFSGRFAEVFSSSDRH